VLHRSSRAIHGHGIRAPPDALRKSARKQVSRLRCKSSSSSAVLALIGLFKLFKALLLIAVGIGAIRFLHKDLASTVMHWVEVLRVDPDNRLVQRLLLRVFCVSPKQLRELSVVTFLYAGLLATEGVGILLRKRTRTPLSAPDDSTFRSECTSRSPRPRRTFGWPLRSLNGLEAYRHRPKRPRLDEGPSLEAPALGLGKPACKGVLGLFIRLPRRRA